MTGTSTEPRGTLSLDDMRSLARRIRSEAEVMRRATERQARIYVLFAVLFALCFSWAFVRVARFIDTDRLAATTGDIAITKALNLVDEAKDGARAAAPQVVRQAEKSFVLAIPDMADRLNKSLKTRLGGAVRSSLATYDHAFIRELSRTPDASRRIFEAASDPSAAARLTDELKPLVEAEQEVRSTRQHPSADLVALRDHFRHLGMNEGLTPSERAERRFMQVVMTKFPADDATTTPARK